ncbi:hypothetical protein [Cesiribacter andamanensis]|uniref:Uncharacterized protein n=1 Tax=Cesiribacter andamanensis AMV16 TaxID=1279009 RepID=M7NUC8_9BACT|nr:hypothetical protein [Cesiribacter andamanensis]EMR02094.1 hypothetical protein ADICEAN_02756 [Cesiribacter andamanensis AMV16]
MKLNRNFWLKLAIESLLIVFSVLLALFLNNYWASKQEAERTEVVLHSIREELRANKAIVEEWQKNHQAVLENIAYYRPRTQAYDSLVHQHQFQFGLLFTETLVPNIVRSTAWETAKTTGMVQHFDLELATALSDVYDLQRLGPMRTIEKLTDLVNERQTHQREHVPQTLVLFQFAMQELVGQEYILLQAYTRALQQLDARMDRKK